MEKFVSIIIVNWNGKKWLERCINSLMKQSYHNYEIIFVDNASTDGSAEFVRKKYPRVIIIQNDQNYGFAKGNNIGFNNSKGEYVLLINSDTESQVGLIEELLNAFDIIPNLASVQPKLVLMNNHSIIDSCGSFLTNTTFLYHYGNRKDQSLPKYNIPMPVYSHKGAVMMIKRKIIEKIHLFDNDFWCYYEETDFCHRAWIAGFECWYYPTTTVKHESGFTAIKFDEGKIQFHNFKNKLLCMIKNFEALTLLSILPIYFCINIILSIIWILQGKPRNAVIPYKAIFWNIINIRATLKKRLTVQSNRKRSDRDVFKSVKKNPKLTYYYYLLTGLEKYNDTI